LFPPGILSVVLAGAGGPKAAPLTVGGQRPVRVLTETPGRRTPRLFLSDARRLPLSEIRLVDAAVQTVSLLPHVLQRQLATFTAQVNFDAAKPVTRVLNDEHRLRAGGHGTSLSATRRTHPSAPSRSLCTSQS
jgi:hypothetical protein